MKEIRREAIQCIDYFLGQEIASGGVEQRGYAKRISKAVLAHGHTVQTQDVYTRKRQICVEGKVLQPASFFAGRPTPRVGKDQNYHHLFALWDQWVARDERYYIGLPANQLDNIAAQIDQGWIHACELDPATYKHMMGLRDFVHHKHRKQCVFVALENANVFTVMQENDLHSGAAGYNFFDLDLMIKLPGNKELHSWAQLIYHSANTTTPVILHVSAYAARVTTELEHRRSVKVLCNALEHVGFNIVGNPTHHIYQDSAMPMGCLRVVLRRRRRAKR